MNSETGLALAVVAAVAVLNEILQVVATYWTWLLLAVVLIVVGRVTYWRRKRAGSAGTVQHWSARSRRHHGVASVVDIARVASFVSVRAKGTTVRPSLQDLTWRQWARTPTTEMAIPLCRVGALRVWASTEDVTTIFGGPRVGKTGWLAGTIVDAPGAVLTTSTRLDLYNLTAPLRGAGDRPVFVFNPGGVGDLKSTVSFNPLAGCENPVTAVERAADLIPEADGAEGERWDAKARRNLAVLLHAAALGGVSCATLAEWLADLDGSEREILSALRRSPELSFVTAAKSLIGLNEKTQTSITDAIAPAFAWLTDPAAVGAATGDNQLDIPTLLQQRGTVYLLGRHEGHTAPLLAALTGHIARTARRIAARQPGGRLDPPLMLALDEAARIAPVPLPDWSGDFGGSGVCIVAAFQSRADLINKWGKTGAAVVLNNSGSVVVFGGTKDGEDLKAWSDLTGERDEAAHTPTRGHRNVDASKSAPRRVPVLSPAQIANLPARRVLVICRGMPPAVGRVRMAWKRPDVRRAQRATQPTPVLETPAPAQHVAPVVDIDSARKAPVA